MKTMIKTALAATAVALGLLGCGGGDGGASGTGALRLSITDAPACGYDEVNITVTKVRVHKAADADDADGGWSEVMLDPPKRVDLLELTNGVLEELGQTSLPAGKYTQMRLVLAPNTGADPFANSVVPTGGTETALITPSAQQSGLKMNVDIDIAPGQLADFAIDVDACKSIKIVQRGSKAEYNLRPVVTVIPVLSSAGSRVVGYVDPSIADATAVSVQLNGVPVKATVPDASGTFVLYPVPPGQYDLVVSAAGRVTAVMTGVPVTTSTFTTVNSTTLRILPPSLSTATATTTVTGTVTPATATASVRALQTLTGGPTIEVAWGAVDDVSGAFTLKVPNEAPVKTAYVANPVSLNFVADNAVAGRYTIEAVSGGVIRTQDVNTANAVSGLLSGVLLTFP